MPAHEYMHRYMGMCVLVMVHMWRTEDIFWHLAFSLYHLGVRGHSQMVSLGSKHFYLLSHHVGPLPLIIDLLGIFSWNVPQGIPGSEHVFSQHVCTHLQQPVSHWKCSRWDYLHKFSLDRRRHEQTSLHPSMDGRPKKQFHPSLTW